jgi:H+/Cl- antiporter ClcA
VTGRRAAAEDAAARWAVYVAVGGACGILGAVYLQLLHHVERWLGPEGRWAALHGLVLVAVGLAVAVWKRLAGDPGDINILFDNIHMQGGEPKLTHLRSLLPISLLCVGAGGAMGPEAPLVQTAAGVGTAAGRRLGWTTPGVRTLTLAAMAAGFAVLFGTPLGAAVFGLEFLHRRGLQYHEALMPAVLGALSGTFAASSLGAVATQPVWAVRAWVVSLEAGDYLVAVALGIVGLLLGAIFVGAVRGLRVVLRPCPWPLRLSLGGLALALLAMWSPFALTFGEIQTRQLLSVALPAGALLTAAAAKLAGASITLASGWKGGFIIPLFFVGMAVGQAILVPMPGLGETAMVLTALMAATNASVTKTPIGSALVVCGMMASPTLPTTLVASLTAWLIGGRLGLMTGQQERSGREG